MVGISNHPYKAYPYSTVPNHSEAMKRYFELMVARADKKNKLGIVYPTDVSDMVRRSLGMEPLPFLTHWTKALRDLRIG